MKGLRNMPKTIKNIISSVHYYNCGYCKNQLAFVYKKYSPEIRKFPSGVFLIKHPTKGYVLFDTGYSMSLNNCGVRGKLYKLSNPTYIRKEDEISYQLTADGISLDKINFVVLSHLHPDHIGGIKFFPKAKIVISHGSYSTYKHASLNDLIFKELLPEWFEDNLLVLEPKQFRGTSSPYLNGYDLFGDGSLILTMLNGHTKGHLGAYIPDRLILAGDACWGRDLMPYSRNMRAVAKLINNSETEYHKSLDLLEKLQNNGVKLYFSHDTYSETELL